MNEPKRDESMSGAAEDEPEAATEGGGEAAPPQTTSEPAEPELEAPRPGGWLRLFVAVITLPWMLGYGIIGAWAVTRGVRGVAAGVARIDVDYTHLVTPAAVIYVGALLLTAFAVLLTCSMLLIYDRRSPTAWIPVLFVSAGLTGGAVWAAARGGLHPGLWLLYFFGLVYVVVVATMRVVGATRDARRGAIAEP